jgi:type II secretory pathway predicted ATPase ExeA
VTALLGPRASGRTTLLRRAARQDTDTTQTLIVSGRQQSAQSLVRSLLATAGFDCGGLELAELRRLLDVFIDERLGRNRRLRIAVDDADHLSPTAFAELTRLRRPVSSGKASPELLLSLVHVEPDSSPAADFIRSVPSPGVVVLTWLTSNEVNWYLSWRLERFGLSGLFTPAAVRQIELCTRGCFSSIDHISQLALLLMRQRSAGCVDQDMIRDALRVHASRLQQRGVKRTPKAVTAA